jgi:hypothetical protein
MDEVRDLAQGRCFAVALVALDQIWEHLRRGKCQPVWDVLLAQAEEACEAMKAGGWFTGNPCRQGLVALIVSIVCNTQPTYWRGGAAGR